MSSWRERDHTRGSLYLSMGVLALPMLASSLAFIVFQTFDLAFISRLGNAPMASVVIVNQTLRQTGFMLVMGMSFAAQTLIAAAVGGDRLGDAEHVAGQALALGSLFSTFLALLGGLAPAFLFSLPGPDPSFVPYGVPYLQLVFLLNFGSMGTLFVGAILGGAGDTTTPLLVTLAQTVVAIAAEWVLIFGHFGFPALGVRGVALGLAAGQFTATGLGLAVLLSGRARVHLRRGSFRPEPETLKRIARLAWPPALHLAGSVLVTYVYLRLAGSFGEQTQTAYAVGLRLSLIVPMFCFPLATAGSTLVAQALGSGNARRARQAVLVALSLHAPVMWLLAAASFLFRHEIMTLLSEDPEVVRLGADYLKWTAGSFALWAFYFVFMRTLQGAGDFLAPMLISLGCFAFVGVPLAYHWSADPAVGPTGIWMAQLASSVVSTALTGARLVTGPFARRTSDSVSP